jgi:hypothetical protein
MRENSVQARSCDEKALCSNVDSDNCTGCDLLIVCVTAVLLVPDFFASYARISTIASSHVHRLGLVNDQQFFETDSDRERVMCRTNW